MRLIHRDRDKAGARAEGEDADRLHSESPTDPEHHVTTERLKQQFEDRLAARLRRRRSKI